MSSAKVVINCIVRASTERGIALYEGAKREYVDESTGEILEKEHWHWVPRRFVTRLDGEAQRGRVERVELPVWLAKQEGLI